MKTKKILAIALSCLLLIGVAAGISASAADSPAVAIAQTNLSYEGAIRILYTLDTANLEAGQTTKVAFSYDADAKVANGAFDAASYDLVADTFTLENGSKAAYSMGFAPADMTKTVYAIPVVLDAAGAVVASGNAVGFSVYDYMMARFDGGYSEEQFLLYMATLDFGGSVQAAQKITEGTEPQEGYADEYYALSVMNGDGSVTNYKYNEPTDISLKAPKGYNNKLFDSFVDNKGVKYEDADFNIYNFKLDKIGTTYVKFVYGDTYISMESLNATAGNFATLQNPDTDVVVKGGTEYFLEAEVELAADTVAALDFMATESVMIGTVSLTEADGVITVSDGLTSFTMENGQDLKIEYTVISATEGTGTLFYYVNNEFVAKTDIPAIEGFSNASFASVVARATAGEISLSYANVGANDGVVTFTTTSYSTVVYDYDEKIGKYFFYDKTFDNGDGGRFTFDCAEPVSDASTTTLEAKVKLNGNFMSENTWRNAINMLLYTELVPSSDGSSSQRYTYINTNIAFTPSALHYGGASNGGTQYPITDGIAVNEWFDLKIEHVGRKSFTIYINGEAVYSVSSGTSATDLFHLIPSSGAQGDIYMADVKYTNK